MNNELIVQKAAKIKLLILDVDGVLTTGKLYFTDKGEKMKVFHVHDGYGMIKLLEAGIEIAIFSGRISGGVVGARMQELGVKHICLGCADKQAVFLDLREKLKLSNEQIAYVGDDIPDLTIMQQVGLSIAVPDAIDEVKQQAMLITQKRGGKGAVREVCDLILRARKGS